MNVTEEKGMLSNADTITNHKRINTGSLYCLSGLISEEAQVTL